jgi:hypothetical protein
MATVIGVTSDDMLLRALDQHTPPGVVLPAPDRQPLDQALVEVAAVLDAVGHLVVLVPAALPDAHRRRLHCVRALLESDRIALVPVDLPPLGVALLGRQLRQISQYDLGPGVLASAARLLAHYVYTGAVLGSVARVDRIEVGLAAHLKSWVPGARFAVLANPEARVAQLTADASVPGPGFPTDLVIAQAPSAQGGEWVRERLRREWHCQHLSEVPQPADSTRWWGTSKAVEFAAYIGDIGVLYQLVTSAHREPCRWCGLELVGDTCGFCGTLGVPLPAARTAADP